MDRYPARLGDAGHSAPDRVHRDAQHRGALLRPPPMKKTPVTSGLIVTMTPYTHNLRRRGGITTRCSCRTPPAQPAGATCWARCGRAALPSPPPAKTPAAALRWVDALYGEDGALLAYAGVEGEDYAWNADGTWSFADRQPDDQRRPRKRADNTPARPCPVFIPAISYPKSPARSISMSSEQNERVHAVSEQVVPAHALSLECQQRATS